MTNFPDFSTLTFDDHVAAAPVPASPAWETPEGIAVKSARE